MRRLRPSLPSLDAAHALLRPVHSPAARRVGRSIGHFFGLPVQGFVTLDDGTVVELHVGADYVSMSRPPPHVMKKTTPLIIFLLCLTLINTYDQSDNYDEIM